MCPDSLFEVYWENKTHCGTLYVIAQNAAAALEKAMRQYEYSPIWRVKHLVGDLIK